MPQLFQVLRCYKCLVFQVHQTKKAIKWQCKLCGEKQSIKRHYGLGTGKECRLHVQKLNGIRGEIDEEIESLELKTHIDDIEYESQDSSRKITDINNYTEIPKKNSKWKNFIEEKEQVYDPEINESVYLGNTEVVLEMPSKKRKKFNVPKAVESTPQTAYHNKFSNNQIHSEIQNRTLQNYSSPIAATSMKSKTKSSADTLMLPKPITQKENNFKSPSLNNHQNFTKTKISKPNITENKQEFVPVKVNKNSKWAQFAEELDENIENVSRSRELSPENAYGDELLVCKEYSSDNEELCEDNPSKIQKESQKNLNNLFSMCNETDLDDILDF